ncbi:unnamed protein product [Caretta caretta]
MEIWNGLDGPQHCHVLAAQIKDSRVICAWRKLQQLDLKARFLNFATPSLGSRPAWGLCVIRRREGKQVGLQGSERRALGTDPTAPPLQCRNWDPFCRSLSGSPFSIR